MTWTNIYTQRSDKQYMFVEKDYKMKIKQQKQIEEFLNEEFETENSNIFLNVMRKTDLWESTQEQRHQATVKNAVIFIFIKNKGI